MDEAEERLLMMKTMADMDEDEVFSARQFKKLVYFTSNGNQSVVMHIILQS